MKKICMFLLLIYSLLPAATINGTYTITNSATSYDAWYSTEVDTNSGDLYSWGRGTTDANLQHLPNSYTSMKLYRSQNSGETWTLLSTPKTGTRNDNDPNWEGYGPGSFKIVYFADHMRFVASYFKCHSNDSLYKDKSYVIYSDDTAKTWSDEILITTNDSGTYYSGVGKTPQVHNTGRLIIPFFDPVNKWAVYVSYTDSLNSLNDWHIVKAHDSTGNGLKLNESGIVELKVNKKYTALGKILILMRNEKSPYHSYYKISNDGGETWGALTQWPVLNTQGRGKLGLERVNDSTIVFCQGVYHGEVWRSFDECNTFTMVTPNFDDRDSTTVYGGYYPDITPLTNGAIGITWCTNYQYQSDVYFTSYQLFPVDTTKKYRVKFTLPKNSEKIKGLPIPLKLNKLADRRIWDALHADGKNYQIKTEAGKILNSYADTLTFNKVSRLGWIWFTPDTLDTIPKSYYLEVGKGVARSDSASIFTNAHIFLSCGFNEKTGTAVVDRTGNWNGTNANATINQSGVGGAAYRLSTGYINYGDVTQFNNATKLTTWAIATQDTIDKTKVFMHKINKPTDLNRWELLTNEDGNFYDQWKGGYGGYDYSQKVSSGQPFLIGTIYDGTQGTNATKKKMVINGAAVNLTFGGTAVPTSLINLTGINFYVSDTAAAKWNGTIDEMGFADTTLPASYLSTMYKLFIQDSVAWGAVEVIKKKQTRSRSLNLGIGLGL